MGYLIVFLVVWIGLSAWGLRAEQSRTIAIGGGFLAGCVALVITLSIAGPEKAQGAARPSAPYVLPECDSRRVDETLARIVNERPRMKERGIRYVSINAPTQKGFNDELGVRVCSGTIITTESSVAVRYDVRWLDRHEGTFSVELRKQ